jgi:hypothetical protein
MGRRWMGDGGGGTDYERQGGGGGRVIQGEEGGAAMGEPHARRGRRTRTRSSRIANVRQKETREIKTMPRRGEDDPHETR